MPFVESNSSEETLSCHETVKVALTIELLGSTLPGIFSKESL
jgi:hypothetical protein